MWRHAVVGHRAPRVIRRRRLRNHDISGVARELSAFERPRDASRSQILPSEMFAG